MVSPFTSEFVFFSSGRTVRQNKIKVEMWKTQLSIICISDFEQENHVSEIEGWYSDLAFALMFQISESNVNKLEKCEKVSNVVMFQLHFVPCLFLWFVVGLSVCFKCFLVFCFLFLNSHYDFENSIYLFSVFLEFLISTYEAEQLTLIVWKGLNNDAQLLCYNLFLRLVDF